MAEVLAIEGGERSLPEELAKRVPTWPPVHPETAELLKQVYLSGKWSFNGPYEQRFARAFARMHGARHGIFMANGTVTLQCALEALGIGPGDEVIVPALTWMATAMAVLYAGARPVFVDIEPDTLCLDPEKVKQALTPNTRAVIPVHIYGSMADMEAIGEIAAAHDLKVIEDCAHAHGGIWNGRGVGSLGDVGSFSLQQSKTLTSGEGGICLTNDPDLAEALFRLKHIGYDDASHQGQAATPPPAGLLCHNFRATEFQAAILLDNLKYLQEETERRDANAGVLAGLLADVEGVRLQKRGRMADLQGYYMAVFLVDTDRLRVDLAGVRQALIAEGLPVGGTYGPVYRHALWSAPPERYRVEDCRICEEICSSRALTLGHKWLLTDPEVMAAVARTFAKVLRGLA